MTLEGRNMIILRLGVLTCAFYLGISVLMEALLFGLTIWKGSIGVFFTRGVLGAVFAAVWLSSFSLAWHFVFAGVRSKLAN
jgi:hypothetical protein